MADDIARWLEGLGLGQYAPVFADNAVSLGDLPYLTDEDLTTLGLPLGPRRRLEAAIKTLAETSNRSTERQTGAQPDSSAEAVEKRSAAERRQLTVLFCDLVGSTELSRRLDPEVMAGVIGTYQDQVAREVACYEGHVAKFMGDGVLVYFGWPRAHEDDEERAVRAGLAVTEAVSRLRTPADEPLTARVGIATGLVVVGDMTGDSGTERDAVVGETPNLAARLQSIASPGSVVVSRDTRRLLGELFDLENLGSHDLKGFREPVSIWRVLGESRAESRFDALHGTGLTPLAGREQELAMLLYRWQVAKAGEGQVVLIASEAGVGKSRMVRTLRERLGDAYMPVSHYGSPHHTNSALHPVIRLLERAARFERADPPETRLRKLESLLALGSANLRDVIPLIAALLSLPLDARYTTLDLNPRQQKQRTLEALVDQLQGLATRRPVLAVFEDAHWMDPTTLELLDMIVQRVPTLPILVMVTFRPEFVPPWTGYPHVVTLTLSRLTRRHGAEIIEKVTNGKSLPPDVLDQILMKTDGIPLFVEELTKTVMECGLLIDAGDHFELSGPLPLLAIPATLHDSLLARLDRLGPVKEVAQIGAVMGRTFSYELLAAVSLQPAPALWASLEELVRSELVFRRGTLPEAIYSFKHALVQDVAYESLLKSRRHQLHARIAAVLEERFPETVATEPEVLAHHLSEAGLYGNAVEYWRKAGEIAVRRSASVEAIAHFSKALEALVTQPDSQARSEQELALQMALAVPLVAAKGHSGIDVERVYSRAQALCEEVGTLDELFPVLRGLWNHYLARGEMQRAHELAVRISAVAEEHRGPLQRALASRALGSTLFFLGRFAEALHETDRAIAIDEALEGADSDRTHLFLYGERPGLISRLYAGWASWFLGFPDRAVARFDEALARAERLGHAYTLAFAMTFAADMRNDRRDFATALEYANAASRIAAKHDLPLWLGESAVAKGYAEACLGFHAEGIGQLRLGISGLHSIGDWHHRSHWLGLLAAACLEAGAYRDALIALDEALEAVAATQERYYAPELERLRGVLSGRQGEPDEAAACFQKALRTAAGMGAKSLELRAAVSLARLWSDQGRHAAAFELLAPVYGWFTEGFDTADLREARTLLDQLA
ncbi:MAG: adenylate/guanylate cyclase domain-containing protein [Sphingomonadaceae bacterium]